MNDIRLDTSGGAVSRRSALGRLAGAVLSFGGLTAFRRFTPDAPRADTIARTSPCGSRTRMAAPCAR